MLYPEFNQYLSFVDPTNPLCNAYRTEEGHIFYVEPGFYEGLMGFKEGRRDRYDELLQAIYGLIGAYPRLIFTWNAEAPFMIKEGFLYREIGDIADPLGIYFEDKSRGSDYGD
jgi:hypothetical protein